MSRDYTKSGPSLNSISKIKRKENHNDDILDFLKTNDVADIVYSYDPSSMNPKRWKRLQDTKKLVAFLTSLGLSEDMSYNDFMKYATLDKTFYKTSILVYGQRYIDIYLNAVEKKWTRGDYLEVLDSIILDDDNPKGFWFIFGMKRSEERREEDYRLTQLNRKGDEYVQRYLKNDDKVREDVEKLLKIYIALPPGKYGLYNNDRTWEEILEYIESEITDQMMISLSKKLDILGPQARAMILKYLDSSTVELLNANPLWYINFNKSILYSLRSLYNIYQQNKDPLILLQMASLLSLDQLYDMET